MTSLKLALVALLAPVALAAQATPPYRGFTPGISYRAFIERARALADSDVVRCQTSPRTAQIMECGVVIRDPGDRARFYLSAHFVEGNADVVALYDSAGFGDARGVALVNRTKQGLTRSEEHTSELQSQSNLVCRLLLEKKKNVRLDLDIAPARKA